MTPQEPVDADALPWQFSVLAEEAFLRPGEPTAALRASQSSNAQDGARGSWVFHLHPQAFLSVCPECQREERERRLRSTR